MGWMIYPAILLVIVVVLSLIRMRRNKVSAGVDPSERRLEGEPIGGRDPSLAQSATVLPERPVGPGNHF